VQDVSYTKSGIDSPVILRIRQRALRQRAEGKEGLSETGCLESGFGIRYSAIPWRLRG